MPRTISEATRLKNNARAKAWRESNPEQAKKAVREWLDKNKERKKLGDREYRSANLDKLTALQKERRAKDPEAQRRKEREYYRATVDRRRDQKLCLKFNVPMGWYAVTLAAQDGKCKICATTESKGNGRFHVDHNRSCCSGAKSCGKCVRALLCHHCNSALGGFKDSPALLRAAAAYIESFQAPRDAAKEPTANWSWQQPKTQSSS